jgi:hypothetical protein
MRSIHPRLALVSLSLLLGASVGIAQEPPAPPAPAHSASDLAKATQNPISDLTSIPFQFNFFSGGPLEDRSLYNLNFQPVVPFKLGKYNLIARTIVPYLDIPVGTGTDRVSGFGDIQQQFFFSPAEAGSLIVGAGPVFSYPTATNDAVRTGDWAIGPTAVVVKMTGPFVLGGLVSQLWTFAGDDIGPNINLFTLQPFVNYNLPNGWALAFAPVITANWAAEDDDVWTVPLGIGISKVAVIGRQPVSLGLQYYNNVERPSTTGQSQIRIAVSFLFPNPPAPKAR